MEITRRTIAPAGRNKYGNYYSSGDITRSVTTVTYAGNNTTTSIGTTGTTDEEDMSKVNFYCMLLQTSCVFNEADLNNNSISAGTQVLAYKGYDVAPTIICDIDAIGATAADGAIVADENGNPIFDMPVNSGVTGIPNGITMSTVNNGTSASTIVFTADSRLADNVDNSGTITIPVTVYKRDDDLPDATLQNWYDHAYKVVSGETGWEIVRTNYCETVWLEFVWNLNRKSNAGGDGESAWYLTLDNDNASINADANGNIYSGAVRPTCHAKLYYGSTRQSSATYNIDYGGASGVTGLTSLDGILTLNFTSAFTFPLDTVHITVSGITSSGGTSRVRDVKTMNITKSKAGANGADGASGATGASGQSAVSSWLEPSYGEIIYNPNLPGSSTNPSPSAITCSGYTQVGDGEPTTGGTSIYYKWQHRDDLSWGQENPYTNRIVITSGRCMSEQRLRFILKRRTDPSDPNSEKTVDVEDIDILVDGMNGAQGQQGERGAVIRGPYDYYAVSATDRCWCAGEPNVSLCDDCEKWIDIVYKDNTYYRCTSGYSGPITDHFPENWSSGTSYDFVATRLLLAENAKINFLTNNELYLMDENGKVTGGARGGSGITFWAGGDISGNTNNLPFRVMTDGTMYAMNGVFGGYIRLPFTDLDDLTVQSGVQINSMTYDVYSADNRAYLIAYPYINDINRALKLPAPSSGLNGFTYDIVIHPALSQMERPVDLNVYVSGGTEITSYAFSTYKSADNLILTSGRFQITCIPASSRGAYKWALISASGNLVFRRSGYSDEYVSTLLATSNDTQGMINNVHTYTGDKPSSWSDSTTMYVKK